MNYYEHHIGDFLKKTVHLSAVEEGIYRRLLDRYYTTEQPLPADVRECCKLARASTKAERDAVRDVLRDFFTLEQDGHHQSRADEEIARYREKSAKAKRSAEARWNAQRPQSEGNANAHANASPEHMRTHCEGNATRARPQSPVTSNQSPEEYKDPRPSLSGDSAGGTRAGALCRRLMGLGIARCSPGHPELAVLLEAGASDEEFEAFVPQALKASDPFPYLLKAVRNARVRAAESASQMLRGPMPQQGKAAPTETAYQRSMRERIEAFAPEIAAKAPGNSTPKPAAVIESETTLLEGPQ